MELLSFSLFIAKLKVIDVIAVTSDREERIRAYEGHHCIVLGVHGEHHHGTITGRAG